MDAQTQQVVGPGLQPEELVKAKEAGLVERTIEVELRRRAGVAEIERSYKGTGSRRSWIMATIEGDSPVGETGSPPLTSILQSSAMLVERGVNPGGPPSKAKYYSTTDSAQVG